jgi:hypothetical protein
MNLAKRPVLLLAVPLAALLVLGAILDLRLRNRGATSEDAWLASPGGGVPLTLPVPGGFSTIPTRRCPLL